MIKNAWDLILHVNQTINTYGKYNALLFASFLVLFLTMEQSILAIMMVSVVLLLWNPILIALYGNVFPYFTNYWQLLWIVPVFFVIAQAAAVVYAKINYQKKGIVFGILLIALAGTILPYQSPREKIQNQYGIPEAEYEVFEQILQEDLAEEVSIVGPNEIMEYARIYSASITLPYGKDLWRSGLNGSEPVQGNELYSPQVLELYQMMQSPFTQLDKIAQTAAQEGCMVIVLPLEEESDAVWILETYGYLSSYQTQKYHIFIRKG